MAFISHCIRFIQLTMAKTTYSKQDWLRSQIEMKQITEYPCTKRVQLKDKRALNNWSQRIWALMLLGPNSYYTWRLYCSDFFHSVSTNIQSDECVCQCISFMSFICEILKIITLFCCLPICEHIMSVLCACVECLSIIQKRILLPAFRFELYVGDSRYKYDSRVA